MDGNWRLDEKLPTANDDQGNVNNVIDVGDEPMIKKKPNTRPPEAKRVGPAREYFSISIRPSCVENGVSFLDFMLGMQNLKPLEFEGEDYYIRFLEDGCKIWVKRNQEALYRAMLGVGQFVVHGVVFTASEN